MIEIAIEKVDTMILTKIKHETSPLKTPVTILELWLHTVECQIIIELTSGGYGRNSDIVPLGHLRKKYCI